MLGTFKVTLNKFTFLFIKYLVVAKHMSNKSDFVERKLRFYTINIELVILSE